MLKYPAVELYVLPLSGYLLIPGDFNLSIISLFEIESMKLFPIDSRLFFVVSIPYEIKFF